MPSIICRFHFDISAWRVSGSKMCNMAQWRQWAECPGFADGLPDVKPELPFLPAMQRRRLSKAARLVCDAAWDIVSAYPGSPVVYASHDGEMARSFDLWLELLKSQTVSPTSFGLSVHNATAGQWSILRQDMSEQTALAVCADGVETALAEAASLLEEGFGSVLVLVADDPLPEGYAVSATRAPFAYALAMVLTKGTRYSLTLSASDDMPSETGMLSEAYWSGLEWVRFLLNGNQECRRVYRNREWLWQRNG